MTRRALRQAMRAQKKELQRHLVRLRWAARDRAREVPSNRRRRRRRRLARAIGLALLVLLACLIRCECGEASVAGPPTPPPPPKAAQLPVVRPPPARPRSATVAPSDRGSYANRQSATPSWLEALRLQVGARSGRLSQCFAGSERPGALRWTAAVHPETGVVSDQGFEPLGTGGGEVRGTQRECLAEVLSHPPYRLGADGHALPDRVSLVLEF